MAARTSLTGVAVSSGYVQLIHVGDDGGLTTTETQLFDGNGTGSPLKMSTVGLLVTLGTGANNDFGITDGSTEFFSAEGDVARVTFLGDGSAGSDFILNDGTAAIMTMQSDLRSLDVLLGGNAGNDFTINDGTADILKISSDLRDVVLVLGAGAGNDFRVNNGSIDVLLLESDTAAMTFKGDASAGSDFVVHDSTNPVMTVATDTNDTTLLDGHQILVSGTVTGLLIGGAASDKLGFFGATPVVQQPKASFNNWTAATDVAGALAALGLVDAA